MICPPQSETIALYRERHVIEPVPAPGRVGLVCVHDGITVHRIRGGWRHDVTEVRRAARGEEFPRPLDWARERS